MLFFLNVLGLQDSNINGQHQHQHVTSATNRAVFTAKEL